MIYRLIIVAEKEQNKRQIKHSRYLCRKHDVFKDMYIRVIKSLSNMVNSFTSIKNTRYLRCSLHKMHQNGKKLATQTRNMDFMG